MKKGKKLVLDDEPATASAGGALPGDRAPSAPPTTVDFAAAKAQNKKILEQIDKQSAVLLKSVPTDFLFGEHIDLHRWSLVLTDENLRFLSEQSRDEKFMLLDASKGEIPEIFARFWETGDCQHGILSLNISNAKDVTNVGLIRVARRHPQLRDLNISGCHSISDVAIREVGMNCRQLASLNLSACHSIDGAGFVAIAECCKLLRKLNISKCRNIQKWGLAKIFYECKKLEEVDVSFLKEVGDEEVRVLAQNCPNMVKLVAKEACYVSDQGIAAMCQYCPDLDFLDVSRSQMAFRITDTSLLTIGQRTPSMRALHLNGCDAVTDVGLAWLAEGCQMLEELDLGGCNRLSDAGLRSLGTSCKALTSLNVSHAKVVSDIGVASLCSGCPRLTKLVCSGIFLLCDPRLNIPRKGEKPAAWQNVIGVAAIAKHCQDMRHLEFANCFRLDVSINRYVATLTKLRNLNLAGCLELSPESVAAMAEGCTLLEELNLSDCTKAVQSSSMRAVGTHCKELKVLLLGRCEDVKGGCISGLVLCRNLEKLDLSSCKALTDEMLMPLSDPSTIPKLKHLSLVNVVNVTDRTLAWIAAKVQVIQYFALKGTSVRRSAYTSVRDSFPSSDLVLNDNFSGYWPKSRIEDRALISRYGRMINGFITLQARLRGHVGRSRVEGIRRELQQAKMRLMLQCAIRCFIARRLLNHKRREYARRVRAATIINCFFRLVEAKKRVVARKAALYRDFIHGMVLRIQCLTRRYFAKCELFRRSERRRLLRIKRAKAALRIQCFARMIFAKRRVARIKQMLRSRRELENRKALLIQRCYRGSLGRMRVSEIRRMKREWAELCIRSASKIQYAVRRMWIARILNARILKKRIIQASAVKLQALVRGFLARLMVMEMVKGMEAINMDLAAIKIQYCWLRKKARLALGRKRVERDLLIAKRHATATFIQKHVRAMWARMLLVALREEAKDYIRAQAELEIWAAIKIQAAWRGVKGRMHFDDVVRERKGLWKELFDEDKKKRFFYNKLTGEIRWKIPQDLLDLLPRPKCDNCGFYEAAVECAVCNEFFCSQCWDQVHYGGRRKNHDFRALYDYYGKRLDYGDDTGAPNDDFPSKWPSDIVSDEVHGWMLRVAPVRAPVSVAGDWEEYLEEAPAAAEGDAHHHHQQPPPGRTFFFNRSTFEATYDRPGVLMPPAAPDGGYYDPNASATYAHNTHQSQQSYGYDPYGTYQQQQATQQGTHGHGAMLLTGGSLSSHRQQQQHQQQPQQPQGFTIARTYSEYPAQGGGGEKMARTYSDAPHVDATQWMEEQQQPEQQMGYYDAEGNWVNDEFSYMYRSQGGGSTYYKR